MIGAIVRNNIVENVIVLNEAQIEELSEALECEIVDARPYGLCVGDLHTPNGWTRNAGGEQILLPLLTGQSYKSYDIMANKVIELEEKQKAAADAAANEAISEVIAILTGEVEE